MKAGWQIRTLGDACQIARGGSPRPIQQFLTDDPDGVNWVKISDATASDKFIYETKEKIKPAGVSRSRLVKPGDFLLSNSMSFGRPYIMQTSGCIHDGWLVLSGYEQIFDQSFLYYLLGSPLVFEQFDRLAAGSTVRNLNIELASRVLLPVPPLAEQHRIVAILDEAFDGIAIANANAEKNLQNARTLFQVHLNQFFEHGRNEWQQITFGDAVVQSRGGISIKSSEYSETGVPVLTKGDIKPFGRIEHGGKYVEEDQVKKQRWPLADPGDLIVATRDLKASAPFLGLVSRVPTDRRYLVNQGATYFKVDESRVLQDYFVYWCCCARYREHVVAKKSGATQVHIREGDLFSAPLLLPPLKEQRLIISRFDELQRECKRLASIYQQKLVALDNLKKSLLHQAFSGTL